MIRAETIVIATGSAPVELPFLPFGGNGHLVDRSAGADRGAASAGRRRRRLYRAGARHRLRQARLQGHRGRGAAAHPAALRRRTDAAGRQAARRARRRGAHRRQGQGPVQPRATRLLVEAADGKRAQDRRPTRSWSPSAASRVTEGWGLEEIDLDWTAASSASTTSAAPRCAASMPSATSPASRCWRTAPWRRARWWPRSSPATSASGTSAAIPAVCFTDPEIVTAGLSPDEAKAPASRSRSASSRSRPTAAP